MRIKITTKNTTIARLKDDIKIMSDLTQSLHSSRVNAEKNERTYKRVAYIAIAWAVIITVLFCLFAQPAHAATVEATAYCDHGLMADGGQTKPGVAAVPEGTLPLGTKITLTKPVFGRVKYTVRDHIGAYSQLDLWTPDCGTAWAFGRRTITYRVGWPRYKKKATLTGEGRVRHVVKV